MTPTQFKEKLSKISVEAHYRTQLKELTQQQGMSKEQQLEISFKIQQERCRNFAVEYAGLVLVLIAIAILGGKVDKKRGIEALVPSP